MLRRAPAHRAPPAPCPHCRVPPPVAAHRRPSATRHRTTATRRPWRGPSSPAATRTRPFLVRSKALPQLRSHKIRRGTAGLRPPAALNGWVMLGVFFCVNLNKHGGRIRNQFTVNPLMEFNHSEKVVRERGSARGIYSDGTMAAVGEVRGGLRLQRKRAEEMACLRGPSSQGARCRHPSRPLCTCGVSAGHQTARGT